MRIIFVRDQKTQPGAIENMNSKTMLVANFSRIYHSIDGDDVSGSGAVCSNTFFPSRVARRWPFA